MTPVQVGRRVQIAPPAIRTAPDGLPDLAAAEAAGKRWASEIWSRHLAAVRAARQAMAQARRGDRTMVLTEVARRFAMSPGTLYRWLKIRREQGAGGLIPKARGGRGRRAIPAEMEPAILECFLTQQRQTMRQVYDNLVVPLAEARGVAAPSYSSLRRFIRRAVRPLDAVAFREGQRAYNAKMAPKVVRELPEPGQVWCADFRLLDVMVECEDGKARRPWACMVADVGSACWVGWRLCDRPSAAQVCYALRRAIALFGPPAYFVRDNGREFTARRLGGKPERLRRPRARDIAGAQSWPASLGDEVEGAGIWEALGVELISALPYSAWSKPIESYFGAFARTWENLVPGFCGTSTKSKPEALKQTVKDGLLLRQDEFTELFDQQCWEWNLGRICGDRKAPPFEVYRPFIRPAPAPETLAYLLQDVKKVRVRPSGVELGGEMYWHQDLPLYVGLEIRVRRDPGDPTVAFAYPPDAPCFALAPLPKAAWGAWSEANEIAQRGRRMQKARLTCIKRLVTGTAGITSLDPTGALETVGARVVAEQRAAEAAARKEKQDSYLKAVDEAQHERLPGRSVVEHLEFLRREEMRHGKEPVGEVLRIAVSHAVDLLFLVQARTSQADYDNRLVGARRALRRPDLRKVLRDQAEYLEPLLRPVDLWPQED
jgi:transposase InsO family protein